MQRRRVVITGMGAVSPYGKGCERMFAGLLKNTSAVSRLESLAAIQGLAPRVAGLVRDVDISEVPRKHRRSMSRMSVYALLAAQEAAVQAGVESELTDGRVGLYIGSTLGSVSTIEEFFQDYLRNNSVEQMTPMLFFKAMGHSVAANVAQALGITGRVAAPSSACSTGCQSIGLAYEAIAFGRLDAALCGGADEYHPLTTATFDLMLAASSKYNEEPQKAPRPFDKSRDGVVCAEGAGVLLLESLDSALARKAPVLAEVIGFASTTDPSSIANPDPAPLYACMRQALENAEVRPEDVSYVNAHATATIQGDIAESRAVAMLFGGDTPVSSLKGHMGHTMAASGALELIACVRMLRTQTLIPTLNLDHIAEECEGINLIRSVKSVPLSVIVKNNFALGGVNCCLVLRSTYD